MSSSTPPAPSSPATRRPATTRSAFTRLRAKPGRRADLLLALEPLLRSAATEPGLGEYSMHERTDDADELWFFVRFADDAAIADHQSRESAFGRDVIAALSDAIAEPPDTSYGDVVWTLPDTAPTGAADIERGVMR
jgi:quinol monooxygenase YgiN